jgi:hypothetical protein
MAIRTTETISLSWIDRRIGRLLAMVLIFWAAPALAGEVCPLRAGQPLRFVDVFDGSPDELAKLMADEAKARSGYWRLDYVYAAGRFVTVRCKYDDEKELDVKLTHNVARCDYRIDARKTLALSCK